MEKSKPFFVKVGGDYACFTDPNLKVERVSYPVMTPAAARGILEAIFWKPAFRWEIRSITVLKPIKTLSVMRNEIKERQSDNPIIVEASKQRQQRVSLILKDVEYVIEAEIALVWKNERIEKYIAQFERKLERGACHHMPYLGTREFSAWFEPTTAKATENDKQKFPIDNQYIGVMFFDTAYVKSDSRVDMRFMRHKPSNTEDDKRTPPEVHKGYPQYLFFPAGIEKNQINFLISADAWNRRANYRRRGFISTRNRSNGLSTSTQISRSNHQSDRPKLITCPAHSAAEPAALRHIPWWMKPPMFWESIAAKGKVRTPQRSTIIFSKFLKE
jgi:CRISPR-associated protein Cas5d